MKKSIRIPALFMLMALMLGACRKGKKDELSVKQVKLKTADHGPQGTYAFTYDALGRMQTEVYSGRGSYPNRKTSFISYDDKGRLLEYIADFEDATPDSKVKMTYEGDKLARVDYMNNNSGAVTGYIVIKYPSSTLTIIENYNAAGAFRYKEECTFDANGKNLLEDKYISSAGVNEFTTTYVSYDDKKRVDNLYPVGYYPVITGRNNNLSFISKNIRNGKSDTTHLTFEYNADGYPTKRTSVSGAVSTYEYIYQ